MTSDYGPALLIGPMVILTAVIHLIGLTALLKLAGYHVRHWRAPWLEVDRILVPLIMVLGLLHMHSLEILAYAILYCVAGAVSGWLEAVFVSAGAYSTMGLEGIQLPLPWKLLAAMESMNGMLLTGWSTAFLFQNMHRILVDEKDHPLPVSAIAKEMESDEEIESQEKRQSENVT